MIPQTPPIGSIPDTDIEHWNALSSPHPSPEQVAADAEKRRRKLKSCKCPVCKSPVAKPVEMCGECWAAYHRTRRIFDDLSQPRPYSPRVFRSVEPENIGLAYDGYTDEM